jgi:hypothetical protein
VAVTAGDTWQADSGVRQVDVAHTWANHRLTRGMFSLVLKKRVPRGPARAIARGHMAPYDREKGAAPGFGG